MKLTAKTSTLSIDLELDDKLAPFFVWLAAHRLNESAHSILILINEYDQEKDADERVNILNTIREIMEDGKITATLVVEEREVRT